MIKVLWCSPHPNHYNNYLFEHLAQLDGVQLELAFFQKIIPKYPWQSDLALHIPTSFLKKRLGIDWGFLKGLIFMNRPSILIVAGWNEPTMIILLTVYSLLGRPFILWSDTPSTERPPSLRNWLRGQWLSFIFHRACRFFVTGKPGVKAARQIGVPPEKIVNFPFATNTAFFRPPAEHEKHKNPIRFIASGRLDLAHKGYDIAVKALALCHKQRPDLDFHFSIAGTGPDEKILRELIRENQLDNRVELKGWLEPHQLLEFYHSGHALLHPSHFDPFPNAVLEAMACGLPVIGSDKAGSVADRIQEGKNGLIHPDGDIEALCRKIIHFLDFPPEERKRWGQVARATALKWDINYHKKIFQEAVESCHES
ncbi:MAG: glycosyltransferase family 4 protein [Phaeodactylibacter sp.]|nr:glycosyltransferase family 4 protein [Phaeodactylibacter sp.]MCB9294277.1 glycosyltransferase family 4 protein [Lewinellaceae bacterium]